jgi:uracil-DNA glycosylase
MLNRLDPLAQLLGEIRACRACEVQLSHGPRPILRANKSAKLAIISQAPGIRAHNTGLTFNDRSGDRLRDWLGIDRDAFYDETKVAIIPMGFCFPGYDTHGGDRAPRRECAKLWRARLFDELPQFRLTLLVGSYAQAWHLGSRVKGTLTETVASWRSFKPRFIPLPHPSWRNNGWLRKNPWFESELLPYLRQRVRATLST